MSTPLLEVRGLGKRFVLARGFVVQALDGLSFSLGPAETLALVGESGSGKSTLARIMARLAEAEMGQILLSGEEIGHIPPARFARHADRAAIQMVFQEAEASLNPWQNAGQSIADPLRGLLHLRGYALNERVEEVAALCGLAAARLRLHPAELSALEKVQVGLARALAPAPKVLILDEPFATLESAERAEMVRLLAVLRQRLGFACLYVTQDLVAAAALCERAVVLYLGKEAEEGTPAQLLRNPAHPYTQALAAALPGRGAWLQPNTVQAGASPTRRQAPLLPGPEAQAPLNPPAGLCRFANRCRFVHGRCQVDYPPLLPVLAEPGHRAACHLLEGGLPPEEAAL